MNEKDFLFLAEMLHKRSGITLPPQKKHLVESRLTPVARRFGFKTVTAVLRELQHGNEVLSTAVTAAMTINYSAFFRDKKTFEEFRDLVLPALTAERAHMRRLRIWCAACAAGQEAYSIAMLLDEAKLADRGWTIELIASDINATMIERAREGVYSQHEVQQGLPIRKLVSNFAQEGTNWRISESLRRMVDFRVFNLLDPYDWQGEFDVVFCRNVLMYFDAGTRVSVLERMGEILADDGVLLLSPNETISDFKAGLAAADFAHGLYRKAKAPALLRRVG